MGDVFGPASSTDNALARFDLATGKIIQNSNWILDDNGKMAASIATEEGLSLTTSLGAGAGNNLMLLQSTSASWDRPHLRINKVSTSGGAASIRLDGPGPDIEMVDTDMTSPQGKFEMAVNSDTWELNGRDAADSAFEPSLKGRRYGAATAPGSWGIGTLYDTPNAMLEIVRLSTQAYFNLSTAVGGTSGNVFTIDTNGGLIFNDQGSAVHARFESDTDANLLVTDGTNNVVNVGFAQGDAAAIKKLNVSGEVRFGKASTTTGRLSLGKSTAAGYTIIEPGAPGSDVTVTCQIVSGTMALTSGNASISSSRFIGGSSTPGIAAGAGAGTTPTVSVTGNDAAGLLNITTGTTPTGTNAIIATITFNTTYASAPRVIICPANRAANGLTTAIPLVPAAGQTNGVTTTTFVLESNTVALTGSTAYIWTYQVIQ